MELYQIMRSTSAVRDYDEARDVPDEVLHRVLDSARFAPSGGNRQGWRVIVVRDPETRRRLRDLYLEPWRAYTARRFASRDGLPAADRRRLDAVDRFAERLDRVPVLLAFWVDMNAVEVADAGLDRPSVVAGGSIFPFVHNVSLACRGEGLGTALTTLLSRREPEVRALLGAPDQFALASVMTVGYPRRPVERLSRRPVAEFAFRERFGGEPLEVAT